MSSVEPTELVYDFSGFSALYRMMRYDTPPAQYLGDRVTGLVDATLTDRGLDHGA